MVDLETLLTYLTLISVPIGVFYHIMTLNNTRKNQELILKAQEQALETRQAQLFMSIFNTWTTKENLKDLEKWLSMEWTDYDQFMTKYGPEENPEDHASWDKMIYYFEGLGLLVKQELVNPDTVSELLGMVVLILWDRFGPLLLQMRENVGVPTVWSNFEYLYHKMNEYVDKPEVLVPR